MTNAIQRGLGILGFGLLLATAMPVRAEAPKSAGVTAPDHEVSADWATWTETLAESAQKVRSLRAKVTEMDAEVSRMRSRRYPRGEERARLLAAFERARTELEEAEASHPLLLEEARQAGVPQGMLQEFEEIPASQP